MENSPPPIRILFVDDESAYRRRFRSDLRGDTRYVVETAEGGAEALRKLESFRPQIVFTDLRMPFMGGIELVQAVKQRDPEVVVLVLTCIDSATEAVQAIKAGACDYLLKPLDMPTVRRTIEKLVSHYALGGPYCDPRPENGGRSRFENLVGRDPKMYEIFERIARVARTGASVLITGESGTGKELVARAIHARSQRAGHPFVAVNCAALPESLIQNELFGHEKGAFTGAEGRKKGFFEQADGGTILLDEIGDIPPQTQVSLLRVLEAGCFQRVGGTETVRVDLRVICATNCDLSHAIREKLFREDLFYRINVVSIAIPPLRERKADIPLLAQAFLEKYAAGTDKSIRGFGKEALALLLEYPWPGNVRELSHAVEHAVIFCKGGEIAPGHFPVEVCSPAERDGFSLKISSASLQHAEEDLIRQVLAETNWNLKQAAETLEIARGTLYSKMRRYEINRPALLN